MRKKGVVEQLVEKPRCLSAGTTEEGTTGGWRDRAFLFAYQLALIEPMPE